MTPQNLPKAFLSVFDRVIKPDQNFSAGRIQTDPSQIGLRYVSMAFNKLSKTKFGGSCTTIKFFVPLGLYKVGNSVIALLLPN